MGLADRVRAEGVEPSRAQARRRLKPVRLACSATPAGEATPERGPCLAFTPPGATAAAASPVPPRAAPGGAPRAARPSPDAAAVAASRGTDAVASPVSFLVSGRRGALRSEGA